MGTNGKVLSNSVVTLMGCVARVLLTVVIITGLIMLFAGTDTDTTELGRIFRARPDIYRDAARGVRVSRDRDAPGVGFSGMGFACNANSSRLRSVDFGVGHNRAMNLVNNANYNGDALIGLVPHFCSTARNAMDISNEGIGSCPFLRLHSRVNVIPRRSVLFGKAVHSGVG